MLKTWRSNFEWEGGGRSVLYLTDLWLAAIWSKKGHFFLSESLNIFATGCSTTIDKCILEGLVLFDANDVQCCSS